MKIRSKFTLSIIVCGILAGLLGYGVWMLFQYFPLLSASPREVELARALVPKDGSQSSKFIYAALDRTKIKVRYDAAYSVLAYPNGDVPSSTGVCTDEVIRCYRTLGIDLQKLVYEDMMKHFADYPNKWGLTAPDANIDHRRVPNLHRFFTRQAAALPVTENASDYHAGDLVTYGADGRHPHIAIIVPNPDGTRRPWILHNNGFGPKMEDKVFYRKIDGHFRWLGNNPLGTP